MPSYFISAFDITRPESFARYAPGSVPTILKTIARHKGEILVAGGDTSWVDGERQSLSVIRFPTMDDARAWTEDPEYAPVRAIRFESTDNRFEVIAAGPAPFDAVAFVREGVDRIFNAKDLDHIAEFAAEDILDHTAPEGLPPGREGYRMKIAGLVAAFPDLHIEYEQQLVDGDTVAGRFVMTGTHRGPLGEIPATGRSIRVTGQDMVRVRDGVVVEVRGEMDTLEMMQQLGVL